MAPDLIKKLRENAPADHGLVDGNLMREAANEIAKLFETLFRLERWSTPFIEKTHISAETLWREFPAAIENARVVLGTSLECDTEADDANAD